MTDLLRNRRWCHRYAWSRQQLALALVVAFAAILTMTGRPLVQTSQMPDWLSERTAGTASARPFADAPPFILCGAAVPGGLHDPLLAADGRPRPVATVVSSEPLSHAPGKRVTVAVVKFAPGAYSPPHVHGGTVSVYILKGTIRSQIDSGPIGTFKPGDTFFEPLGAVHTLSENVSTSEPAELLAIFVHEEGATLTTYLE